MPMSFSYINNTKIEDTMFDIVEMDYPYSTILRRDTLNDFEGVVH
jgi:hypothetical protein